MWGVPANDECFSHINAAQWMWYYYSYLEDKDSGFIDYRNLIEYQVSFSEPKVIQEIIRERQSKEAEGFNSTVKGMFGRDIEFGGNITSDMKNVEDLDRILSVVDSISSRQRQTKDETLYNFNYWLNINLEQK